MVNPSRDTVLQEELRSPSPSKTEENPFPISDALLKKQIGAPPIKKSRRKKKLEYLSKAYAFMRQWSSSDCFDLDDPPIDLLDGPCVIKESDMKHISSDHPCIKCVEFAIKSENDDKNLSLELVRLVKYNVDFELRGQMYYLTFIAKDKEGREDVYQAKVLNPKKEEEELEEEEEEKVQVRNKYVHNKLDFIEEEEGDEYDLEDDEEEDEKEDGEEEGEEGEDEDEKEDGEEEDGGEEEHENLEDREEEDGKEEDDDEEDEDEKDGEEEDGGEEHVKEDRKEEDGKEKDELDYEGNREMKVLIFRKKSSGGDQQSKGGVEEKHGLGKKRCCCGKIKHGCSSCGCCSS